MRIATIVIAATILLANSAVAANSAKKATDPTVASLRSVAALARKLQREALDVINDVEQRAMVVTGEPDIMMPRAMKDDNKPVGWAPEMIDLGPAQAPKQSWLSQDVGDLGEVLGLLTNEVNNAQPSADQADEWAALKAAVGDIQTHYNQLKTLCAGPKYDNIAIGKQALKIYDDVKLLEKPWKAAAIAAKASKK